MSVDVFDLYGKIKLDASEFKNGLEKAKEAAENVGKIALGAVGAASAAVTGLVKQSVDAYSEYEQLTGGITTLFEDLDYDVFENASNAFMTAGLSANEYMETVMSFSASLNQSLQRTDGNIARSAEIADLAIIDMSDNANKMGTAMESIQNAYQGFAKQNYTMLDNLKLGYGGTKAEMERLLDDAGKLANTEFDIENFSDIIEAIHVIQENIGITGTTSKEAASTIEGSTKQMKAAWQNLLIGLATGEDDKVENLMEYFIGSAETALENIEPRIEIVLSGMGKLIEKAAPILSKTFINTFSKVAPSLIKAGTELVVSIGKTLITSIPELSMQLLDMLKTTDFGVANGIRDKIFGFFDNIDIGKIKSRFSDLVDTASGLFDRIASGGKWALDNVIVPVGTWLLNDALPPAITAISDAFSAISGVLDFLKTPAKAVWEEFLKPLAEYTGDFAVGSLTLLHDIFKSLKDLFGGGDVDWEGWWIDIFSGGYKEDQKLGIEILGDYIDQHGDAIEEFFRNGGEKAEAFCKAMEKLGEYIYDVVEAFKKLSEVSQESWNKVFDFFDLSQNKGEGTGKGHKRGARGGVVTHSTFMEVGENGAEAIMPLQNNTGWIDVLASKIKASNSGNNDTAKPIINVSLDGAIFQDEYSMDVFVEKLSEKLGALSIQQIRALGGVN